MIASRRRRQKSKFFLAMGSIGLIAVLIGFSTTFIIPIGKGAFKAPWVIYAHGAFAFAWVICFLAQSSFIQANKLKLHRRLGLFGVFVATGVTVSSIPVGLYQVERELALGLGQTAISSIIGTINTAIVFCALVVAGMVKRREPATHKRLMLLATILMLWPAWFRFRHLFPAVPNPEIWFAIVLADSLIIISMLWDKVTNGRVNPTLLYAGLFVIMLHTAEAYFFDSYWWREVANRIYSLFT